MLQINIHRVDDLASRALIIVDDDFLFLDARRKLPASLGDQLVIVFRCGVLVVAEIGERAQRKQTRDHNNYKQHRQVSGQTVLVHLFFLLFIVM